MTVSTSAEPYSSTWIRRGVVPTPCPPAAMAVTPSSYVLAYDPLAGAMTYVRPPEYHHVGELWRFRQGSWEGPFGTPAQVSADAPWQGHWDSSLGGIVMWSVRQGAPLAVLVTEAKTEVLPQSGEVPQFEANGFRGAEVIFAYDPLRERSVALCPTGLWERDPKGSWTRALELDLGNDWREANDRHAAFDAIGERLVLGYVDKEQEAQLLTWDGTTLGHLPTPEGGVVGSFPDALYQLVSHPKHGLVMLLGGERGAYRLAGEAWEVLPLAPGLPRIASTSGAATPEGELWVGPGTHDFAGANTPFRSEVFLQLAPGAERWTVHGHVKTKSAFSAGSGVHTLSDGQGGTWICARSPGLQIRHVDDQGSATYPLSEKEANAAWKLAGDPGRSPQAMAFDDQGRLHAFGSRGNVHRLEGQGWELVAPTQLDLFKEREEFLVAWDAERSAFLVWGGEIKGRKSNHTFVLEGDAWRKLKANSAKPADFAHGRKDDVYVKPFLVRDPLDGALLRFGYEDVSRLEGDLWVPHSIPGYREAAAAQFRHAFVDPDSGEILIYDQLEGGVTRFDWVGCTPLGVGESHPEIVNGPNNTYALLLKAEAIVPDAPSKELRAYLRSDGSAWYALELTPFLELAREFGPRTQSPLRAEKSKPAAKKSKPAAKNKSKAAAKREAEEAGPLETSARLYTMDSSSGKAWFADVEGAELVTRWGTLGKVAAGEASEKRKAYASPAKATAELSKQAAAKRAKGYQEASELSDASIRDHLGSACYSLSLADAGEEETHSFVGGLPPGLPAKRWPRDEDGTPWTHVATVERFMGGKGAAAVAVFVAPDDRATEEEVHTIPLSLKQVKGAPTPAPEGALVLPRRGISLGEEISEGLEGFDPALADRLEAWHATLAGAEESSILAGQPTWLQAPEHPTTEEGKRLHLVAQLDFDGGVVGGHLREHLRSAFGCLYVFVHPSRMQAQGLWQYT